VRLFTTTASRSVEAEAAPEYLSYGTERKAAQALLQIVNPSAVARLQAAVQEFRPDVVHVHAFAMHLSPSIFAQLRSVPTVVSVHDYKPVCPTGAKLLPDGSICTDPAGLVCLRQRCTSLPHWLRDRPRYLLLRVGLRSVDRVLTYGVRVQRELAGEGIESELLRLPVRLPGSGFKRAPADHPLFVFCGRLSPEKGVPLLLRAFARLLERAPTARLHLVGAGAQRRALEQLAADLTVQHAVSFRGWVTPEQLDHELAGAWALVAPSLHAEPFGLVAVEALVRGVPVVASATGGFAESVQDGLTGLLFPNANETALVQQLEAIARRRAFPAQRIPDGELRRVREAHALDRHLHRLRETYAEAVAASRARHA